MQTQQTVHASSHTPKQPIKNLALSFDRNYDNLLTQLNDGKPRTEQPTTESKDIVTVLNGKKILRFYKSDIYWIESAGDYLFVHTKTGRSELIRKTMKAMEQLLGQPHFIRVHRSYIVNKEQIFRYGNNIHGEKMVTLRSGHELTVSRRFKSKVAAALCG